MRRPALVALAACATACGATRGAVHRDRGAPDEQLQRSVVGADLGGFATLPSALTVRNSGPRAASIMATTTLPELGVSNTIPSAAGPVPVTVTSSPS